MLSSTSSHPSLLNPALLAAVDDLHLIAKSVVDGFLEGMHTHPISKMGTAFRQYRPYFPGDDPRLLDWKMFARSDRYFIRETETESNVRVRFLMDCSRSMAHADEGGPSKLRYTQMAVAALAYMAHRQGDGVVALGLNDCGIRQIPSGRPGLMAFLEELAAIEAKGVLPNWPDWSALVGSLRMRELVIVLTDFYEHGAQLREALGHLRGMGREVMAVHLTTRQEKELSYRGPVAFEDLETGETVLVAPDQIRKRYQADLEAMGRELQNDFAKMGIDYCEWVTDEPLAHVLRGYIMRRMILP